MIIDDVIAEMEGAAGRSPINASFGVYVLNGVGIPILHWSFFWFEDRAELLRFVRELLPAYAGLRANQTTEVLTRTRAFDHPSKGLDRLPNSLEKSLRPVFVMWSGTLSELCTEKEPVALTARQTFRDNDDGAPIREHELPSFVEFVQHYSHIVGNAPGDDVPSINGPIA